MSDSFSLIVGYGTESGTTEDLAMQFTETLREVGVDATEVDLNDVEMDQLASATHFAVIIATYGEGEFPYNSCVFWETLSGDDAPRLDHLNYAVLGLGDSIYPLFCNAGKLLDGRLRELGATAIRERVDADVDFDEPFATWRDDLVKLLTTAATQPGETLTPAAPAAGEAERRRPQWDRKNPYTAQLTVNRLLTATSSDKEVRHYEIDLGDSGISYAAGDSLAVHPVNQPELVEALLTRLGVGADHRLPGHDKPLGELLTDDLEIRTPSRALLDLVVDRTADQAVKTALGSNDHHVIEDWLYGRDVLDLLDHADLGVAEVVDALRPLQFRDYSIASSPLAHANSIHLTVASVRYGLGGRDRHGVASTFLADRAESVRVHLAPNHGFRLPAADVPIIMVGPGTGIAPFRAFLQERAATGATGKSWLFFGDRRRATDFLYGEELQGYVDSGVLTRLDLAFSRDQEEKDYVQHHMLAQAGELYEWLQAGAYFYVCGDANHMAKDVHSALHQVIRTAGDMDTSGAHTYVNDLIKQQRYVRDVY